MRNINKYGLKKYCMILLVSLFWWISAGSYGVEAQDEKVSADTLNVMFVLDTSYSMNQTDKERISIEMLKLFTDISYLSHTRIGFVAFNDSIESSQPLTELTTNQGKEVFKKNFDSIARAGRTDTGLGLKKAWELISNQGFAGRACLVLLTDGEIDINLDNSQRSPADATKDIEFVIKEAAARNIPIYTVAMGRTGVNRDLLEDISRRTGGASYIADIPQDLIEVFNNIFAANFKSSIVPVASVTATGEIQEIQIKLPDIHAAEANIMFLSSSALKETQVYYGSNNIGFQNTQHYSSVKITNPKQQDVKILFKGIPQDVIKVNMLVHYDLKGQIQVEGQPQKGQGTVFKAWLIESKTGQPIADKNLYDTFSALFILKNLDTGETIKLPASAGENGWQGQYEFQKTGKYSVSVQADNRFFSTGSTALEFSVSDGTVMEKVAICLLIVSIVAMIFYREKRAKPRFVGKINGYYLRLHDPEEEVPPFSVLLNDFRTKKKTSLFEMLKKVHADQGLVEAEDIWFMPGVDKTLILSHNSVCTILIGQNVLCKNQNYVLHYGDKIYVTFPEYGEEIELHYKNAKPSQKPDD